MPKKAKHTRIYLDHASTTPVLPEVLSAMTLFFSQYFYNPSGLYTEGVITSRALEVARKTVSEILSAHSDEVVFTGSGTEADNLAILGVIKASLRTIKKPHVIISAIEHPAIMELSEEIVALGGEVTVVPVDEHGIVDPKSIQKALKLNTVVVSIMYANNEIGTIQPIKDIAKEIRFFKKNTASARSSQYYPYFHTDASQAANYLSLNVLQLGVDLLTLDGSKIYGPKGIGMLYVKRGVQIAPLVRGGGQERGLRSGTENLPYIVGFAKALSIVHSERESESQRLIKLRDTTIARIQKKFPDATLNGHAEFRLPNNINMCFPGIDGEFAVIKADTLGILCSTASSCRTLSENTRSYVLDAMGVQKNCAESSLRFTLGRGTSADDMKKLLAALPHIVSNTLPK